MRHIKEIYFLLQESKHELPLEAIRIDMYKFKASDKASASHTDIIKHAELKNGSQ